jgi:siroheme synthase (precorrin-2 oxidase/ferrochelatase)
MESKYFALKDVDTTVHIAVVEATSDKELKKKIIEACNDHYCTDEGKLAKPIRMANHMNGKSGIIRFVNDEGDHILVYVSQSWLY